MEKIMIVSCGPGGVEYLTTVAISAVEHADVLVAAKRLLDLFSDTDAEKIVVDGHIEKALDKIAEKYTKKKVAILVSGDAGLFSLAKRIISRFGRENCSVIPGVSSVQVAFARLGLEWSDATIFSVHHELIDIESINAGDIEKAAVLLGHKDGLTWTAKLIEKIDVEVEVFVCENLTLAEEKVSEVKPGDLQDMAVSSRSIILIIKKGIL